MNDSRTISRGCCLLLALAALLGSRSGFLLVIVHRGGLALPTASLLRGGRSGGTDLAASVLDLLESGVGADSHALDGLGAVLGGGLVPVDLIWLAVSGSEGRGCTNAAVCAAVEVEAGEAKHVIVSDSLLGDAEVVRHGGRGCWVGVLGGTGCEERDKWLYAVWIGVALQCLAKG